MAEIIYGIDMNNRTSNWNPIKRMCRYTGKMCELATDFGYCQVTACVKLNQNHEEGE